MERILLSLVLRTVLFKSTDENKQRSKTSVSKDISSILENNSDIHNNTKLTIDERSGLLKQVLKMTSNKFGCFQPSVTLPNENNLRHSNYFSLHKQNMQSIIKNQ